MKQRIYLDYAAATPLATEVKSAMRPFFEDMYQNPSSLYASGREAAKHLSHLRARAAKVLGVQGPEIVFTAGATEANNLAIYGVMAPGGGSCVVSAVEHDSVLLPAAQWDNRVADVDKNGRVELGSIEALIDDTTRLISVQYANNETGNIQPIKEISSLLRRVRADRNARAVTQPILFHCDASQAANYFRLLPHSLGVDLMTVSGAKMYGPKQSGCLYVATGVTMARLLHGGGQEGGLRSGTESLPLIAGFVTALEQAQADHVVRSTHAIDLTKTLWDGITSAFPSARRTVSPRYSTPHILHVCFPGVDNERLSMILDEQAIEVAVGSACHASSDRPSTVLAAIGMDDDMQRSCLRFSVGVPTTHQEVERVVATLKSCLADEIPH